MVIRRHERAVIWQWVGYLWQKYRPVEGWLPFFLLLTVVAVGVAGVVVVDWVPEVGMVGPTAVSAFLLAVVLAKRPLPSLAAWLLLISYGLLWPLIWLGQLIPPVFTLRQGWRATAVFWRQQAAFLGERVSGWLLAVSQGGRSQETIVFALGLALLAWFIAAYVGWSSYRQKRPFLGLSLLGIAVAVNGYFGNVPFIWLAAFVALAALTAAMLHFAHLEQFWLRHDVDYSLEIRTDLAFYASGIAIALLVVALALPAFSIRRLQAFIREQTAVLAAEEGLERAFDGVRQPRREAPIPAYAAGGVGVMPRAFLLGNAPELARTVVMNATVLPLTDNAPFPYHWRGVSYATYTGRGWALDEERSSSLAANEPLPLPEMAAQAVYEQQVNWVLDGRSTRYTVGLPLSFNEKVETFWHGAEDLVRVQGAAGSYQAVSQVSMATAERLKTAVQPAPLPIQQRYSQLPPTVPPRVGELAQEIAGQLPTPYEQARALERFLRQYPYALDVPLPPEGTDPVDYFLFELQRGYCDYYASAMVVLARSLGLPARLVTGYRAQPPDGNGIQHLRQIDAHSWVEVYFADYGWVAFEPTAAFATPHDPAFAAAPAPTQPETAEPLPLPPPSEAQRPFVWSGLLWLAGLGGLFWWVRRQGWQGKQSGVVWAYGRLLDNARRLGLQPRPGQTATEFAATLADRLTQLAPEIAQLTGLFVRRQYSEQREGGDLTAVALWRRLKRPFFWLRLRQWLSRRQSE